MDILAAPSLLDNNMRELYEASLNGCVSTLNTLIHKDPLILSRVSLYPFTETPLHIASLLGHLDFCKALLDINPSLGGEVNSEGRCPLHLASAKGHTEVVKALLLTNPDTCMVRDKDDMLPLHFAAMRGRLVAIEELIRVRRGCIHERIETDDSTVLHLCIQYNHLEALKLLVELVRGDDQFLCAQNKEGDTVLHLAVRRRQVKTIKYLLSLSEMSPAVNDLNMTGLSALDVLQLYPSDLNSHTIEQILTEAGVQNYANMVNAQQEEPSTNIESAQPPPPSPSSSTELVQQQPLPSSSTDPAQPPPTPPEGIIVHTQQSNNPPLESPPSSCVILRHHPHLLQKNHRQHGCWGRIEKFCKKYPISQKNWMDDKQLMVAATVIATMTFQTVISPPGGAWGQDSTDGGYDCAAYGFCEAGTAILGYAQYPDFLKFIFFNSTSFFSSLCVLLVLISGFPLDNKVILWILSFLMVSAVTCMLFTYMWALGLTSPNHIYYRTRSLGYILVGTWAFLILLICLIQIIRFIFWRRSRRTRRKMHTSLTTAQVNENRTTAHSNAGT